MQKSDSYRRNLPHYNTAGQIYFVTWILNSSIPRQALKQYSQNVIIAKNNLSIAIKNNESETLINGYKDEYHQARKIYNKTIEKLLHIERNPTVALHKTEYTEIIENTFRFWEGDKIENIAWSIMPNHIHWVFFLKDRNRDGNENYLQDLLHSVKLFTASKINNLENRTGRLWSKESFDTTVRNENHLSNVINYTLQNPVKAGLSKTWKDWHGNFVDEKYLTMVIDNFGAP